MKFSEILQHYDKYSFRVNNDLEGYDLLIKDNIETPEGVEDSWCATIFDMQDFSKFLKDTTNIKAKYWKDKFKTKDKEYNELVQLLEAIKATHEIGYTLDDSMIKDIEKALEKAEEVE